MININELSTILKEQLQPLNPQKIIIFGSYARGTQTQDSDIDIYIVTKDNFIPKNFQERKELYIKVLSLIRNTIQTYPVDVIIHTKKMHENFIALDSYFCRKIMTEGIHIL
jgi:predicted nucleotidyltransferase